MRSTPSESSPLVFKPHPTDEEDVFSDPPLPPPENESILVKIPDSYIHRVLPIALTASLAMAATSATTIFAYADIVCADPAHCKNEEETAYASTVALATTVANVCGVLALGPLQLLMKGRPKVGLFSWLIFRGLSVGTLAIAGKRFPNVLKLST